MLAGYRGEEKKKNKKTGNVSIPLPAQKQTQADSAGEQEIFLSIFTTACQVRHKALLQESTRIKSASC